MSRTAAITSEAATGSKTARNRAKTRAIKEVSVYLGNTPAVCRASYIDPRVFDAYRGGLVIRPVLEAATDVAEGELPIHHRAVEALPGSRGAYLLAPAAFYQHLAYYRHLSYVPQYVVQYVALTT